MGESTLPSKRPPLTSDPSLPTAGGSIEETLDAALIARGTQQSLLVEVNAALAAAIDAEMVLGPILARLTDRVRLLNASIFLLDESSRQLRCVAQSGYADMDSIRALPLDGQGLVPWVARAKEAIYSPDVTTDPRYLCGDSRALSEYAVPLFAGQALLGVLDIESDELDGIRAVTQKLVDQFAGQAALAIERSELYRRLRISERRFRSIFEQSHLGVALCDLGGRFSAVNPAFSALLGYAPEELIGRSYFEMTHPADRQNCFEQTWRLLENLTERVSLDKRLVRKSGSSVWCTAIVSTVRESEGLPAHLLVMVQDITERKKAEAERARLQEQLFHSQKMKALGTLAGGIAHDFNNLLGVVSGCVSLLRLRLPSGDPRQELVAMVEQSAERASGLTRQLLQFSRQEAPELQPVDVLEAARNVLKIVSQTFDRRIQVEADLAPDLPLVEADAGQLEMALLNLCINARDAMPEGGTLTLAVSAVNLASGELPPEAQGLPGKYIRIVVRDTGMGMKPEVLHRVFEPFFTTKEAGKGSGFGLAMVYSIVTHHGGFIGVKSQAGQGTEFILHLPVTEKPVVIVHEETPIAERGRGTVLVADDEPLMLSFACEAVQELGYEAIAAVDGRQACAIYATGASGIDVVLLDMVMPGAKWEETIKSLLAINPLARVVVTSGYNGPREARRAMEQGAAAFIGKPYTVEGLAQTLKAVRLRD